MLLPNSKFNIFLEGTPILDGQGLHSRGSFYLSMLEAPWICLDEVQWTTLSCLRPEASATPSVPAATELTQTTLSWLCRWANSLTTTSPTLRITGSSVAGKTELSQRVLMRRNAAQSGSSATIPFGRGRRPV
jgi:hypothetical protein